MTTNRAIAHLRSLGIDIRRSNVSLTILVASHEKLDALDVARFRVAVTLDSRNRDAWFQVVLSVAEVAKPAPDSLAFRVRSIMADARPSSAARLVVVQHRAVFESGVPARDGLRERDELGLGRCEPMRLREWLASAANKLACEWRPIEIVSEDLDETNRQKLAASLDGSTT